MRDIIMAGLSAGLALIVPLAVRIFGTAFLFMLVFNEVIARHTGNGPVGFWPMLFVVICVKALAELWHGK